jgi:uncharacterized protein YjiS (DUF1127 family)
MSDTVFPIRSPRHAYPPSTLASAIDVGTSAYAVICEWWSRRRSRLELASYSYDQRKDLGFRQMLMAKSQSRSGRSDNRNSVLMRRGHRSTRTVRSVWPACDSTPQVVSSSMLAERDADQCQRVKPPKAPRQHAPRWGFPF